MSDRATVDVREEERLQPALLTFEDLGIKPHHCFACGELNEIGLHLQLRMGSGRCAVDLTLPNRFEGWEGIAHGGIISTILDEVMAWSLIEQDSWGVTARIAVDFKKPVFVGRPIRAEGWIVDTKRRVHRTAGRIVDADGEVLATAEATFVAATEEKKQILRARYGLGTEESR
jgi:uncharacterized protein (TIGR00369 family)